MIKGAKPVTYGFLMSVGVAIASEAWESLDCRSHLVFTLREGCLEMLPPHTERAEPRVPPREPAATLASTFTTHGTLYQANVGE